jgi:iron complex transport system substrate-binding protein
MPRSLAAVVVALTLLAACGDDDAAETSSTAETASVAAGDDSGPAPQRIVSLSPTATEMLFAVGAGDQVVAVDSFSTFPAEAPITDLSAFEPNLEAISEHDPDLVVVDATDPELIAGLETVGIEVFEAPAPADLEGTYDQIVELGEAAGHGDGAEALVEDMRTEIEALVASVPERAEPLTYYHELDNLLYTVTSGTFIGQLYEMVGLENVADAADADGQSGGYPQLSTEYLVEADPDLVFLADVKCCSQDATTFAARPGFGALSAVAEEHVFLLDDDIASRWGPRVVDLLDDIVTALETVPAE